MSQSEQMYMAKVATNKNSYLMTRKEIKPCAAFWENKKGSR